MELKHSDRLGSQLLAISLRLEELNSELHRTRVHAHRLASRLEDARFARLVGGEAGDPDELTPELQAVRARLECQEQLVQQVRQRQWKTRVSYVAVRARERRERAEGTEPEARGEVE